MTSFTDKFRKYLSHDIDACIKCITDEHFIQNNFDSKLNINNIDEEHFNLLLEWAEDYVGNIDIEETVLFLMKYGFRKAIYSYRHINIYNYENNEIAFNRKLISEIIIDNILKKCVIYI
jgi:hypothetical protein